MKPVTRLAEAVKSAVPAWVTQMSDGDGDLPFEPAFWRERWNWWTSSRWGYFVAGLVIGLGVAYVVYHLVGRPL